MAWEIEGTGDFEAWYGELTVDEQAAVDFSIGILEAVGPTLGRPYVDTVVGSRHANMKELRSQAKGNPIRTFFAFDPRRTAILLIGGSKVGDDRFYDEMIPKADDLYDQHLAEIANERTR